MYLKKCLFRVPSALFKNTNIRWSLRRIFFAAVYCDSCPNHDHSINEWLKKPKTIKSDILLQCLLRFSCNKLFLGPMPPGSAMMHFLMHSANAVEPSARRSPYFFDRLRASLIECICKGQGGLVDQVSINIIFFATGAFRIRRARGGLGQNGLAPKYNKNMKSSIFQHIIFPLSQTKAVLTFWFWFSLKGREMWFFAGALTGISLYRSKWV